MAAGADYDTCIENIDIGGPAMIRAAAKNHGFVNVIVDVEGLWLCWLSWTPMTVRPLTPSVRQLAQTAYARTGAYDAAVSNWMARCSLAQEAPRRRAFAGEMKQTLRYGENSHQKAAFYTDGSGRPGVATADPTAGQRAVLQQHQRHRCGV